LDHETTDTLRVAGSIGLILHRQMKALCGHPGQAEEAASAQI